MNEASGHELTDHKSPAALVGFISIPAANIQTLNQQQILDACVTQLGKLFVEDALSPISTHYVDWSSNVFIAIAADVAECSQHAQFNQATLVTELQGLNLGLIRAEFSQSEVGYVSSALHPYTKIVQVLN